MTAWEYSDWHKLYCEHAETLIKAAHAWDLDNHLAGWSWTRPPDDQVSRLLQGIFARMNELGYYVQHESDEH